MMKLFSFVIACLPAHLFYYFWLLFALLGITHSEWLQRASISSPQHSSSHTSTSPVEAIAPRSHDASSNSMFRDDAMFPALSQSTMEAQTKHHSTNYNAEIHSFDLAALHSLIPSQVTKMQPHAGLPPIRPPKNNPWSVSPPSESKQPATDKPDHLGTDVIHLPPRQLSYPPANDSSTYPSRETSSTISNPISQNATSDVEAPKRSKEEIMQEQQALILQQVEAARLARRQQQQQQQQQQQGSSGKPKHKNKVRHGVCMYDTA
jgi:hypothetical protein